ncbi:hypothetical protein DTO280E4_60 [Paecilomyces variotii]|nr:hypothetical protein DTO217A2_4116 [Paecilomyces variotii]KAJ9365764.1 hypothetical protein DTO280E4_60 [Paecilomyces variotii]
MFQYTGRSAPSINPNRQETNNTQIIYHSSIDDKENPRDACVDKMVQEAPLLQYDAEQKIAANENGFGLLAEMRHMRADMAKMNDKITKLEAHRQSHLDIRQRAISTWVRDALNKDTERRNEDIRRLNKDVIHGGDVRSDAMVVTERYKKNSTEWKSFRMLYGLTPDEMNDLDQAKCYQSLQALDTIASVLFKDAKKGLPEGLGKQREDLIAILLEKIYEEAEKMSSTFR